MHGKRWCYLNLCFQCAGLFNKFALYRIPDTICSVLPRRLLHPPLVDDAVENCVGNPQDTIPAFVGLFR
jgi:hypothetical protein